MFPPSRSSWLLSPVPDYPPVFLVNLISSSCLNLSCSPAFDSLSLPDYLSPRLLLVVCCVPTLQSCDPRVPSASLICTLFSFCIFVLLACFFCFLFMHFEYLGFVFGLQLWQSFLLKYRKRSSILMKYPRSSTCKLLWGSVFESLSATEQMIQTPCSLACCYDNLSLSTRCWTCCRDLLSEGPSLMFDDRVWLQFHPRRLWARLRSELRAQSNTTFIKISPHWRINSPRRLKVSGWLNNPSNCVSLQALGPRGSTYERTRRQNVFSAVQRSGS